MSGVVGVDIGGTKIAAALVGADGEVLARRQRPTPVASDAAAVLAVVVALVHELTGEDPPTLVGVGTAGVVDAEAGVVASATTAIPGWAGTPVAARLEEALGCAVAVENDVHAFSCAEATLGAGRGHRAVLGVAVGTGIGAGLVVDGAPLRGAHHVAGALGHVPAPAAEGLVCPCGAVGHLEAIASGPSMAQRYALLAPAGAARRDASDLRTVLAAAADGDEAAGRVLGEGAAALGAVLGGAVNLLDPDVVVLGGGVVLAFPPALLAQVERVFRAQLLPGVRAVPLRRGTLGPAAGAIGAATLARARVPLS